MLLSFLGGVRCGVAIDDELGHMAHPRPNLPAKDRKALVLALAAPAHAVDWSAYIDHSAPARTAPVTLSACQPAIPEGVAHATHSASSDAGIFCEIRMVLKRGGSRVAQESPAA